VPLLPAHWDALTIHYRFRETVYHIHIVQIRAGDDATPGETRLTVDGVEQEGQAIALVDDRREHTVTVSVHH